MVKDALTLKDWGERRSKEASLDSVLNRVRGQLFGIPGGIVAVFAAIGTCHYLLWGRSFSKQVMVEQQDDEESTVEVDGWRRDGPHRPGRF